MSPASRSAPPSRRRVTTVGVASLVAVACVGAQPAAAEAKRLTVRTNDGFITKIGAFRTSSTSRPAGLLAGAIRVFGTPSSRTGGGDQCRVTWRRYRIRAQFVNFGGGGSACKASAGKLQALTVRSSKIRTVQGIRVGSRSRDIPRLHKNARFSGGGWVIADVYLPYGDGFTQPTIKALVRDGRVYAMSLYIGAGGE